MQHEGCYLPQWHWTLDRRRQPEKVQKSTFNTSCMNCTKDDMPGHVNCPVCNAKCCGYRKTGHWQLRCHSGVTMPMQKAGMQKSTGSKSHGTCRRKMKTDYINIRSNYDAIMDEVNTHNINVCLACRRIHVRSQSVMSTLMWPAS